MLTKIIKGFEKPFPVITFGGASLSAEGGGYGFGAMSEAEAEKLIKSAWEAGISVFDTAPIYGFGLSEERLGRYLPQDAFIVSKSGVDWHQSKRVNMTNDPAVTQRMLDESLKRLNRETIDLYMIHWPDSKVDIRMPLEILKKAQEQGKIRHVGLCNTTLQDLSKAEEILPIQAIQSELNLFNQKPFEQLEDKWKDYLSMGWGTFDKGILSGRVHHGRTFDKNDARSWAPWWDKKSVKVKIDKTIKLQEILLDYRVGLAEFCIYYNLYYFGLSTCLVGFKTVKDVVDVSSNLQSKLSKETMREVLDCWNNS